MLPNVLTFIRIISAPILVVILMSTEYKMVLAGLAIFIISSLTDFLDGYLARSFNQSSKLGKILDPIAGSKIFPNLDDWLNDLAR